MIVNNKISAKAAHIFTNKFIAVAYMVFACFVILRRNDPDSVIGNSGRIVFMFLILAWAAGHFAYKRLALLISSVVFAIASGFGVMYVLFPSEADGPIELPELHVRVMVYAVIAMPGLLMMLNYYFYGKLAETGSTAITENQPVATDEIKAKGVRVLTNEVIAIIYAGLSCLVMVILSLRYDADYLVANILLILLGLTMATGHFKGKEWALRVSIVISGTVGLMALTIGILYLYKK